MHAAFKNYDCSVMSLKSQLSSLPWGLSSLIQCRFNCNGWNFPLKCWGRMHYHVQTSNAGSNSPWQASHDTYHQVHTIRSIALSASLSLCQAPIWHPQPNVIIFSLTTFTQLRVCWCGAPSLMRGLSCSFQFMGLDSSVPLGSEFKVFNDG
jgi:hypothetical protein